MKRELIIYPLLMAGIFFLSLSSGSPHKNSGSAPTGRTGAPNETTCGSCHTGGSYAGSIVFKLGAESATEYESGKTYTITFTSDFNSPRFGFSITALDSNNVKAGDFSLVNTANTALGTANNRQYVGQRNASENKTWTFEWKAPEADAGDITFYYVINAANNNGSTSGDYVETGTTTIKPAAASSIVDAPEGGAGIRAFPNPTKNFITFANITGFDHAVITNINGQLTEHVTLHGENQQSVSVADYPAGIYFVSFRRSDGEDYRDLKFIVR